MVERADYVFQGFHSASPQTPGMDLAEQLRVERMLLDDHFPQRRRSHDFAFDCVARRRVVMDFSLWRLQVQHFAAISKSVGDCGIYSDMVDLRQCLGGIAAGYQKLPLQIENPGMLLQGGSDVGCRLRVAKQHVLHPVFLNGLTPPLQLEWKAEIRLQLIKRMANDRRELHAVQTELLRLNPIRQFLPRKMSGKKIRSPSSRWIDVLEALAQYPHRSCILSDIFGDRRAGRIWDVAVDQFHQRLCCYFDCEV